MHVYRVPIYSHIHTHTHTHTHIHTQVLDTMLVVEAQQGVTLLEASGVLYKVRACMHVYRVPIYSHIHTHTHTHTHIHTQVLDTMLVVEAQQGVTLLEASGVLYKVRACIHIRHTYKGRGAE